jgi:hypothetical protein
VRTGDYAECIQQLSLFPAGCEALQAHPNAIEVLDLLVEKGCSKQAKDCAKGALMQLRPERKKHEASCTDVDTARQHIMMSCE